MEALVIQVRSRRSQEGQPCEAMGRIRRSLESQDHESCEPLEESEFLNFDAMRQASQCLGRVIRSKRPLSHLLVFGLCQCPARLRRLRSHDLC